MTAKPKFYVIHLWERGPNGSGCELQCSYRKNRLAEQYAYFACEDGADGYAECGGAESDAHETVANEKDALEKVFVKSCRAAVLPVDQQAMVRGAVQLLFDLGFNDRKCLPFKSIIPVIFNTNGTPRNKAARELVEAMVDNLGSFRCEETWPYKQAQADVTKHGAAMVRFAVKNIFGKSYYDEALGLAPVRPADCLGSLHESINVQTVSCRRRACHSNAAAPRG